MKRIISGVLSVIMMLNIFSIFVSAEDIRNVSISYDAAAEEYISGDFDMSGEVDSLDVDLLFRYVIGYQDLELTDAQFKAGDVNTDGVLDSLDVDRLFRIVIGYIEPDDEDDKPEDDTPKPLTVVSTAADGVSVNDTGTTWISNWGSVSSVQQFIYKNDGMAYAYLSGGKLHIVTPDNHFTMEMKYPLLGDVISDDAGNFYVVWGQTNTQDTTFADTVFISKYSADGIHIQTTGFVGTSVMGSDGNTKTPFDAGSCDSVIHDGIMMVNYARTMYNGHQSNNVVGVYTEDMTPYEFASSWDIPYTSHSFNQRVIWSEHAQDFVYADHGDAYSRGFIITSDKQEKLIFHMYLEANANYNMWIVNKTFAQMGELTETSAGVVFVGASAKSIGEAAKTEKQNLFVQIFDPTKNLSSSMFMGGGERSGATSFDINDNSNSPLTPVTDYGVIWLTDYTDRDVIAPHAVAANDCIVILWNECNASGQYEAFYTVLSADGDVVTPPSSLGVDFPVNSMEAPVYHDGSIYWAAADSGRIYVVQFNPDLSAGDDDGTYTVTFDANADDVLGMTKRQKVKSGACATQPADPEKDGYTFGGWYETSACVGTPYDFTRAVRKDTMLYAKWVEDSDREYGIGEIVFDDASDTFTVAINAPFNVNLNLFIQTEDLTEILHQGSVSVRVTEYLTNVSYTAASYQVPEYFALTVTLTDNDGTLLCEPYTTIQFTERYQQSIAKTIADFDEEKVINLDEQEDTNFLVAREGVEILELPEAVTVDYEEETGTYILSGSVDSLDIAENTELILKTDDSVYLIDVSSITLTDGQLVITESPDVEYKDFFTYIKINDTANGVQTDDPETMQIDRNAESRSVPDIDVDLEPTLEVKFNKDFEKDGIGYSQYYGQVDLTGTAKGFLRILFDIVAFGEDYIEIEVGFSIDATAKANVGIKLEDNPIGNDELRLGALNFPFGTTGVFFTAGVYLPLDWKISGELEVSATAKYSFSRVYNTISGWTPINHDPEASITLEAEAKVEMFWGLKVDIGVYFLNQDFISVSAPLKAGVMIEAEVKSEFGVSTEGVKHECQLCANGTFYPKIEIAISAKFKINDHLNFIKNIPIKVFDFSNLKKLFYVSLINSDDSVHGGKVKLGFGDCPNVSYRADFSAIDYNGNEYETPLNLSGYYHTTEGYSTRYSQKEEQTLPDSVKLFEGYYTASTEIDGILYEMDFSVYKSTNKINLLEYTVNGNVLNAETGSGLRDASVTLYLRDGTTLETFKTGTSYAAGWLDSSKTKFNIPMGYSTIYVKIECSGYLPYYTAFSVPNSTGTLNLGTVYLQKHTIDHSAISGIIIDSHDKVLADVQVALYDSEGTLLYNTLSDQNGVYNIYIQLENGQYTLDFVKKEYSYDNALPKIIISGAPVESYSVVTLSAYQYTVSGKVTDGTNALSGVNISVISTDGTAVRYPSAVTASDGTYSFTLPGGTYSLEFTKADHKSQTKTITVSGADVTVPNVVMPLGELEFGIVRGSEDILAMESVQMKNSSSNRETWTISSTADWTLSVDGDWLTADTLSGSAGTTAITIAVPEGTDQTREAILTFTAENNSFTVKVVQKAGTFTGTVAGKGAAVAGAAVTVYNTNYSKTVTTDADGAFTCSVPDGYYRVKVSADGFAERELPTRYYMSGSDVAIDEITLYIIINVTGQVSDGTPDGAHYGEMLSGVIVEAFDEETGTRVARAKSDSEGMYTLSFNRTGDFKLRYLRAGYCIIVADDVPVLEETESFAPVTMVEDPIVETGVCGDNLTWSVSSMGTLVISGEGEMYIWVNDLAPWATHNPNITSVIIDDGVTTIGNHAFRYMTSLVYVSIPSSVTYIAYEAFEHCEALEEIYIPDSVTEIASNAFSYCSALKEVKLSENITDIPRAAFYDCTSLYEIMLPSGLQNISDYAFTFCPMETIEIPDGVTYIGSNAFAHTKLTNITLPSRLEVLGAQAFQWCSDLQNLVLPEGLLSIGEYAFEDCYRMTSIHIPASVTSIGNYAFDSSTFKSITVDDRNTVYFDDNGVLYSRADKALLKYPSAKEDKSYTIPEGIETIRTGAFNHAYNLAELILPESLRTIEADSMNIGSQYFKTITIPKNVSSIAEQAFLDNWQLAEILVDPENAVYSSVDGVLLNKQEKLLLCYPRAKEGTSYTIPDWVTTIGECAFTSNRLTELIIPNSVTHIHRQAFQNSYITEIHIPASVVSIREDAFGYCYQLTDAYFYGDVPAEWGFPNGSAYGGWNVITNGATIHYIEGKSGWTSPTWTAPDEAVYNTAVFVP